MQLATTSLVEFGLATAGASTLTFAMKKRAILVTVGCAIVAISVLWGFHLYPIHSQFGTEGLLKRYSRSKGSFGIEVASLVPCSIDFDDPEGKRSADSRWVFIDWCHRASISTSDNYAGEDFRNKWRRGSYSYGSIVDLVSGDDKKTIRYRPGESTNQLGNPQNRKKRSRDTAIKENYI